MLIRSVAQLKLFRLLGRIINQKLIFLGSVRIKIEVKQYCPLINLFKRLSHLRQERIFKNSLILILWSLSIEASKET